MTCTMLIGMFATSAMGTTLNLNAIADNGSRFISHTFGGLFELGRTRESTRVDEADGAFYYSELPDYVPLGGGGTAFPHKNDFLDLGTLEYNPNTGVITSLQADFAVHIAPGKFLYAQFFTQAPTYTTSFNSLSGTVTSNGSDTPTVNLTSEIVFSYDGSASGDGMLTYTGIFNVIDDVFVLAVDDTAYSQALGASGNGNIRVEWDVAGTLVATTTVLPLAGDFNLNGVVDAADYTVWRDNLGSSFDLNGNGDEAGGSEGVVDAADYALWETNFGSTSNTLPASGDQMVPEPAGGLLALFSYGLVWHARRRVLTRSRTGNRPTQRY